MKTKYSALKIVAFCLLLNFTIAQIAFSEFISPHTLYRLSAEETDYLNKFKDKLFLDLKSDKKGTPQPKLKIESAKKKFSFSNRIYGLAIVLYRPGHRRMLVVRRGQDLDKLFESTYEAVRKHRRFPKFTKEHQAKTAFQIDFLTTPPIKFDLLKASIDSTNTNRFEVGVDGIVANLEKNDERVYFLPGDAYVKSKLHPDQIANVLAKSFSKQVKKQTPATELKFRKFNTISFISHNGKWQELFRGHPFLWKISSQDLKSSVVQAANHLLKYQMKSGKYLYYYDSATDTRVDHDHPKRDPKKNGYYNIIRHLGAITFLLKYYDESKDPQILASVKKALEFAQKYVVTYKLLDGTDAQYLKQYNKVKLGAQGLFISAIVEYQKRSKDNQFEHHLSKFASHIISQIQPSGEFFYYSIYKGKPVTPLENSQYFDFYYPGEALLGLADYMLSLPFNDERKRVKQAVEKALKFITGARNKIYRDKFPALPMDAWVSIAIERLWNDTSFQTEDLKSFVFGQSDIVIEQQYVLRNILYPDYWGSFFYKAGDHPYPDGARAEGLVAAYKLAKRIGDPNQIEKLRTSLQNACRGLYFLVNTKDSTYSAKNPNKSIGGIRFKLTRQWFRIDTISHVANVFLDFYPEFSEQADQQNFETIFETLKPKPKPTRTPLPMSMPRAVPPPMPAVK